MRSGLKLALGAIAVLALLNCGQALAATPGGHSGTGSGQSFSAATAAQDASAAGTDSGAIEAGPSAPRGPHASGSKFKIGKLFKFHHKKKKKSEAGLSSADLVDNGLSSEKPKKVKKEKPPKEPKQPKEKADKGEKHKDTVSAKAKDKNTDQDQSDDAGKSESGGKDGGSGKDDTDHSLDTSGED